MKLRIEKAIYGGAGLARAEGKAVFVPFTLPGEEVEAQLVQDKGSHATAELKAVIEPARSRTRPPCPYFGACGGCHYQQAQYDAQVEMKIAILRETLERARIREIPEIAAVTGEPLGYRNRIRLHIEKSPFALCYKKHKSHVNLPVATCPIAAPSLQKAVEILNAAGGNTGIGEWATEIELFTNADGSALLASFWTEHPARQARHSLEASWPRLRQHLPALTGAGVFSTEQGRRQSRFIAHTGEDSLRYQASGHPYRVSLGSFFQANRLLIDRLIQLVTEEALGKAAWDLYAGVGLFSLPLAGKFDKIIAVESGGSAVRDLRENLRGTSHRIISAETEAFLRQAVQRHEAAPDLVVVDPPRAGLGREVTTLVGKIRPPRITYVSCDPSTLSRDLAALLESGYRLARVQLVDLFPQTYHMESVTQLSLE